MNRTYELRNEIDKHLENIKRDERLVAVRHLYGVSNLCLILALRRNLNTEICVACGLLHDLWSYEKNVQENHAKPGAELAREILKSLHSFSNDDISIITRAIKYHSDKGNEHDDYSEMLKDADVVHHYLCEPDKKFVKSKALRIKRTMRELGINIKVKKK